MYSIFPLTLDLMVTKFIPIKAQHKLKIASHTITASMVCKRERDCVLWSDPKLAEQTASDRSCPSISSCLQLDRSSSAGQLLNFGCTRFFRGRKVRGGREVVKECGCVVLWEWEKNRWECATEKKRNETKKMNPAPTVSINMTWQHIVVRPTNATILPLKNPTWTQQNLVSGFHHSTQFFEFWVMRTKLKNLSKHAFSQ